MKHIEPLLTDFMYELFASFGIPIHHIGLSCDDLTWTDCGLRKEILHEDGYEEQYWKWLRSMEDYTIYHTTDIFECSNTFMKIPGKEEWVVFGPILFTEVNGERFEDLFQKLKLPQPLRIPMQNFYYSLTFVRYQAGYEHIIAQMANQFWGKDNYRTKNVVFHEPDEWLQLFQYSFRVREDPFANVRAIEDRYEFENALIQAVRNGNEEQAVSISLRLHTLLFPKRLADHIRDYRDYTITLNTLLRKAAEYAGVHPIYIDNRSNRNIQLIEQINSMDECRNVQIRMVKNYCRLVREYSLRGYSLPIRKTLTYINTDLSADLSLKTLAEHLHINASYLSTLFKKEVGVSLTEFVTDCRIKYAEHLLLSTDLPLKTITQHCGFSDLNYFIRQFKKKNGVTPKVFKETAHPS